MKKRLMNSSEVKKYSKSISDTSMLVIKELTRITLIVLLATLIITNQVSIKALAYTPPARLYTLQSTWYMPACYTTDDELVEIALHNPTQNETTVIVYIVDSSGTKWWTLGENLGTVKAYAEIMKLTIGAKMRKNIPLNHIEIVTGGSGTLDNRELSVMVETFSDDGVTLSRATKWKHDKFYFEYLDQHYAKMAGTGTQVKSTQWYFPIVSVQKYVKDVHGRNYYHEIETNLIVLNPGSTQANIELDIYFNDQDPITDPITYHVHPYSNLCINLGDTYDTEELSVVVRSTNGVPVVAEKTMYYGSSMSHYAYGNPDQTSQQNLYVTGHSPYKKAPVGDPLPVDPPLGEELLPYKYMWFYHDYDLAGFYKGDYTDSCFCYHCVNEDRETINCAGNDDDKIKCDGAYVCFDNDEVCNDLDFVPDPCLNGDGIIQPQRVPTGNLAKLGLITNVTDFTDGPNLDGTTDADDWKFSDDVSFKGYHKTNPDGAPDLPTFLDSPASYFITDNTEQLDGNFMVVSKYAFLIKAASAESEVLHVSSLAGFPCDNNDSTIDGYIILNEINDDFEKTDTVEVIEYKHTYKDTYGNYCIQLAARLLESHNAHERVFYYVKKVSGATGMGKPYLYQRWYNVQHSPFGNCQSYDVILNPSGVDVQTTLTVIEGDPNQVTKYNGIECRNVPGEGVVYVKKAEDGNGTYQTVGNPVNGNPPGGAVFNITANSREMIDIYDAEIEWQEGSMLCRWGGLINEVPGEFTADNILQLWDNGLNTCQNQGGDACTDTPLYGFTDANLNYTFNQPVAFAHHYVIHSENQTNEWFWGTGEFNIEPKDRDALNRIYWQYMDSYNMPATLLYMDLYAKGEYYKVEEGKWKDKWKLTGLDNESFNHHEFHCFNYDNDNDALVELKVINKDGFISGAGSALSGRYSTKYICNANGVCIATNQYSGSTLEQDGITVYKGKFVVDINVENVFLKFTSYNNEFKKGNGFYLEIDSPTLEQYTVMMRSVPNPEAHNRIIPFLVDANYAYDTAHYNYHLMTPPLFPAGWVIEAEADEVDSYNTNSSCTDDTCLCWSTNNLADEGQLIAEIKDDAYFYLPGGNHQAGFRLKIDDNTGNEALLSLKILQDGAQNLPEERIIIPSEFTETGEYEDFSFEFTSEDGFVVGTGDDKKTVGEPIYFEISFIGSDRQREVYFDRVSFDGSIAPSYRIENCDDGTPQGKLGEWVKIEAIGEGVEGFDDTGPNQTHYLKFEGAPFPRVSNLYVKRGCNNSAVDGWSDDMITFRVPLCKKNDETYEVYVHKGDKDIRVGNFKKLRWFADKRVNVGDEVVVVVGDYDDITITMIEEKSPDGATFTDGTFRWTPTAIGAYPVTFQFNYGDDVDEEGFVILVGDGIAVTSPKEGDEWVIGTTETIEWYSSGVTGDVKIELGRPSGCAYDWTTEITDKDNRPDINDGSYSWEVQGEANNSYKIRVCCSGTCGKSFPFSIVEVSKPPTPDNVRVISTSDNSITWSWDEVSGDVMYWYRVYEGADCQGTPIRENYTDWTTKEVNNLDPGEIYSFEVETCTVESICSDPSSCVDGTTATVIPPTPYNVRVISTSDNSITWSWDDDGDDVMYWYRVYEGADCQGIPIRENYTDLKTKEVDNLEPGTTYSFKVKACTAESVCSHWSDCVDRTTATVIPPTPDNLSTSTSDTSITWSWYEVSDDVMYWYRVYEDAGCQGIPRAELYTNETEHTSSNLEPDTTYSFKVKACTSESICSHWSDCKSETTDEAGLNPPVALTPVGTACTPPTFEWYPSNYPGVAYYMVALFKHNTVLSGRATDVYDGTNRVIYDSDWLYEWGNPPPAGQLNVGESYDWAVAAMAADGSEIVSSELLSFTVSGYCPSTTTTTTTIPVPSKPNVHMSGSDETSITWVWDGDVYAHEYWFALYEGEDCQEGHSIKLAKVYNEEHTTINLLPGTTYSFEVNACNEAGDCSDFSNCADGATKPNGVSGAANGNDSITWTWNGNAATYWFALYNGSSCQDDFIRLFSVSGPAATHTTNDLLPGTYSVKVNACNSEGDVSSDWSSCGSGSTASSSTTSIIPTTTTTTASIPSPPTNLQATSSSITSIIWSWNPSDGAAYYWLYFYENGNCTGSSTYYGTPNTYREITDLSPSNTYSAKVRACLSGGAQDDCSPLSSSCVVETLGCGPCDDGWHYCGVPCGPNCGGVCQAAGAGNCVAPKASGGSCNCDGVCESGVCSGGVCM